MIFPPRHKPILLRRKSDGLLVHSNESLIKHPDFEPAEPIVEAVPEPPKKKPGRPKKEK